MVDETAIPSELARLASLRDGDLLRREGLFVVESRATLVRALRRYSSLLRMAAVTTSARAHLASKLAGVPLEGLPILELEPARLEAIAGYHVHQGAVAVFQRPPMKTVADLLACESSGSLVVLNRVADPDNVGSVFRSALAFGATGVVCTPGTADPLYRKSIRTSMGATLALPYALSGDGEPASWISQMKGAGVTTVGLTADRAQPPLASLGVGRWALVFGNEGQGVEPELSRHIERWVTIPMASGVDSLNVAQSATVALYELFTQTQRA